MTITVSMTKGEADLIGEGLKLLFEERGASPREERMLFELAFMFNAFSVEEREALWQRAAKERADEKRTLEVKR